MIKYFCDRCGKETSYANGYTTPPMMKNKNGIMHHGGFFICNECYHKWREVKDRLSDIDFVKLLDEKLQPYRCDFKVGDEVITSTGEVGVITDVCTCDRCRERGFFEPKVKTKIGNDTIYITDNDLRVGFRSFYKIGNHVFGNLDVDVLSDSMHRAEVEINEAKTKLHQYCWQFSVIQGLQRGKKLKTKENNNGD